MQLIGVIDRGGFGRVEKYELPNKEFIVKKVFDPTTEILRIAGRDKLLERFKREVLVQSQLNKDSFMPILEYDLNAPEPWFTMPFAGKNLSTEIAECRNKGTTPLEALADILNSLEILHSLGYTHRDIKPENILFHEDKWKLSDFGLISPPPGGTTALTSMSSAWGTTYYCAPEQLTNFKLAPLQSDIYSFGCILHDIFDGNRRVPFNKYSCQNQLAPIIEKCTEIDYKKRFKNITLLRGALFTLLSSSSPLNISQTTEDWIMELSDIDNWNANKISDFERFINNISQNADKEALFKNIHEDILNNIFSKNYDSAISIALSYCEWARRGGFQFSYCDVIVKRLECVFQLGDTNCKASAIIAAAELGASHNRWFVMHRVMNICDKNLDNKLAERIAIEIIAEDLEQRFVQCATRINSNIDNYHEIISKVLHKT